MTQSPDIGPEHAAMPAAEVEITSELLRRLLVEQRPDLAGETLTLIDAGWDNVTFRVGEALAARLPRRAIAVNLLRNEQRWLPQLAPRLPLPVPEPVFLGEPSAQFPWTWSLVRWIEGRTANLAPPAADQGPALAAFLKALHQPAPADAPTNPFRGVPLQTRRQAVEERLNRILHHIPPPLIAGFEAAVETSIDADPVWLHGDPHARNVLTRDGKLAGFIDWGDMCVGDPAGDLACVWMLLPDRTAREAALMAYDPGPATLIRARGWAFLYAAMLLDSGLINSPPHALTGQATFDRLQDGP
jgi:aminoglycoside phosphotransferase (APT) family kinase protein